VNGGDSMANLARDFLGLVLWQRGKMVLFAAFLILTISCGKSKSQSTKTKTENETIINSIITWPDNQRITLRGKLEVAMEMENFDNNGVHMMQRVFLKNGEAKYFLRMYPETQYEQPKQGKIINLVVNGLKGGIDVACNAEYEVEGLPIKKTLAANYLGLNIEENNSRKLVIDQLGISLFKTAVESLVYKNIIEADLNENIHTEVILVQKLKSSQ
jgi:hypothetical protein